MTDEPERIAKLLSRAGIASRRAAERMIDEGRVTVNGKVIDTPATLVTAKDRVAVDGRTVGAPDRPRLWLYHKPEGLVTSAADEKGRATVFDHLPEGLPRVMPVGRLDLNSEGLLLLTNDGELKRRLELPATGWLRKYRVRVKGNPSDTDLAPLRQGITVEGEHFQPMTVTLDRSQGANAWLTVALREGKNREIRRAMSAIGLTVNRLIRTGYGPFRLGDLAPGAVEEVKAKVLRDQLGLEVSGGPVDLPEPERRAANPRRSASPSAEPGAKRPRKPQAPAAEGRSPAPSRRGGGGSGEVSSGQGEPRSAQNSKAPQAGPRPARAPRSPGSQDAARPQAGPAGGHPGKVPPSRGGGKPRKGR